MYNSKYLPQSYFCKYFQVQLDFRFEGGQIAYATLRYFDSIATDRKQISIALNPAILTDTVSDIVLDSQIVDIKFTSEVQGQSFMDSITRMTADSVSPITTTDVTTVRTVISKSVRRN